MKLELDLVSLFNIIGTINGLFITFIILGIKKGNKTTNRIFAALIFSYTLIIFNTVYRQTGLYLAFFTRINSSFIYDVWPFAFFLCKSTDHPPILF
ncbi:MAG: hypothetical protein KAS65_07660 [Candidatus Aminicenantes bacterium]|nr:hypothetical protein [Candidatus Aminicenantes bacterium]